MYSYYVLCEEVFCEALNSMDSLDRAKMEKKLREAEAVVEFDGFSQRLLYKDALLKGYLLGNVLRKEED